MRYAVGLADIESQSGSPTARVPRVCVMMSGGGRTLLNLLAYIRAGELRAEVVLVIASREGAGVERAQAHGLHVEVVPGVIPAARLEELLTRFGVDWVVLAGYLLLVDIPESYRGRVVNIHPALLPKFGGKGMYGRRVHEAVIAAGERESGCSVHFADNEYDQGSVILQRSCAVYPGDTPETLAARVFELEQEAYPAALKQLLESRQEPDGT
jgi:phosphoribosylglycinamide formyltransferase 1